MKKSLLAAAAVATLAGSAMADYVVNLPPASFTAAGGFTVTTPALTGTVTGIIFTFTYSNSAAFSWASDMAATVGSSQWGGYDTFINGATIDEGPTGAPGNGTATTFTSAVLPIGVALNLVGQSLVVGYGNGYSTGDCTMENVSVTLVGTVPTPGAAALLGLGGLSAFRRRR